MVLSPERIWSPGREPIVRQTWAVCVLATFAVAIAYFLAARLSLGLLAEPNGVAVFWPAAGVATGLLIGAGSAARLPVVVGVISATLLANLLGDRNLGISIFSALAN